MTFTVGSLVKARGREWVVLPDSTADLLILRPLGGSDDEMAGIYLPLESVTPATFDLPDPVQVGDYRSARLLRDAVRLGFRSSAGPSPQAAIVPGSGSQAGNASRKPRAVFGSRDRMPIV